MLLKVLRSVGGFDLVVESKGSESRDEMSPDGYLSNNSGGISGGISTGQDIKCIYCASKPTSSINKEGQTINSSGQNLNKFKLKVGMILALE